MADIAELIVALKLRDGISSGLGRLNGQLKGMQSNLSRVGTGVGQVGRGLDQALTRGALAAGSGIAYVAHAAIEFEDAFTGVAKTVDATGPQLQGLNDDIRAMAREIPVAATELAAIAETAGALGIAVEDIDEFTRTVATLGATTNVSSEDAATALGQLSNVLNLTNEDYERFASTLVDLGNKGASTEADILAIATRAGAAGDLIGLSADQVLSFGAAVANLGIEAEAGGSALQKFFIDSLTNLQDDKTLQIMADTAGTTGAAFKKAFEDDAAGALETFLVGLGQLDEAAQIETLQSLGFNDVRITRMLLGFANNTDKLSSALDTGAAAWKANTAAQEEARKKYESTANQIKLLRNRVNDAAITIGNALLPVIVDLSKEFGDFLNQPGTQQGLKDFAEDLAGGIRGLVTELKGTDFSGIIGGMKIAAGVAKGAFDAFRALPEPIQQLAIAALVANKVSGGAVGNIAKGLANILIGTGGLFSKGSSPANPLWVAMAGGGTGGLPFGGGGAGGKAGGLRGALSTVLKFLPAVIAAEVANEFEGPANDLAKEIRKNTFFGDIDLLGGINLDDLQWPFGSKNTPTILPEIFGGNGILGGTGRAPRVSGGVLPKPGALAADAADADKALLAQFGGKLDKLATNEVIRHLERTNEIGQKGIGTSFQFGIADGLDPIGDVATRILARAEDPKAPAVMFEVQQHLKGLEEIQAQYLANGDVKLAAKVQTNIDTLHSLIGTTDSVRAVTERFKAEAASADTAMRTAAAFQTAEIRQTKDATNRAKAAIDLGRSATSGGFNRTVEGLTGVSGKVGTTNIKLDTANANLRTIAGKNWSPIVKVNQTNTVSSTVIQQRISQQQAVSGTGSGFQPGY